jgi:hypothetical protein
VVNQLNSEDLFFQNFSYHLVANRRDFQDYLDEFCWRYGKNATQNELFDLIIQKIVSYYKKNKNDETDQIDSDEFSDVSDISEEEAEILKRQESKKNRRRVKVTEKDEKENIRIKLSLNDEQTGIIEAKIEEKKKQDDLIAILNFEEMLLMVKKLGINKSTETLTSTKSSGNKQLGLFISAQDRDDLTMACIREDRNYENKVYRAYKILASIIFFDLT